MNSSTEDLNAAHTGTPWLLLDCNNLCHRAYHAMKAMRFNYMGKKTDVIFGFFKSVVYLCKEHHTDRVCFFFDSKSSLRGKVYSKYKQNRAKSFQELSLKEQKDAIEMRQVIKRLPNQLREIGFRNVFCKKGYEADDLIAQTCAHYFAEKKLVVSNDKDLLQLLSPNTCVVNPHKHSIITEKMFKDEYGVDPFNWPEIKAMMGDSSDNVKGIYGIGLIRAVKLFKGQGTPKEKEKLMEGRKLVDRNHKLFKLPYDGCPRITLQKDTVSVANWNAFCDEHGLKTLLNEFPTSTKARWKQFGVKS